MKGDNGFEKDPRRASEAGRKSKRKPLDKQLEERALELKTEKNITYKQAIDDALFELAVKKKYLPAIKEYYDRVYGQSSQHIDIKNTHKFEDNPIVKAIIDIRNNVKPKTN